MRRACRLTLPEKSYFAKSSFLNRERSKTIQPQEREKDGMQASRTAFTGGMAEKQMGPKVYTTEVILDDQEFADSKGAPGRGPEQRQVQGTDIGDGFMSIPDGIEDEGMPFN